MPTTMNRRIDFVSNFSRHYLPPLFRQQTSALPHHTVFCISTTVWTTSRIIIRRGSIIDNNEPIAVRSTDLEYMDWTVPLWMHQPVNGYAAVIYALHVLLYVTTNIMCVCLHSLLHIIWVGVVHV